MPDQETIDKRAQERAERREQNAKNRRSYRAKQKKKRAERTGPPPPPPAPKEHGPDRPKVRQGVVTSAKADKTISVRVDTARRHRMYKKIIRESTTLHAHDERNDANEGDLVRVEECRPMSRTKRWRLTEVVERSVGSSRRHGFACPTTPARARSSASASAAGRSAATPAWATRSWR